MTFEDDTPNSDENRQEIVGEIDYTPSHTCLLCDDSSILEGSTNGHEG